MRLNGAGIPMGLDELGGLTAVLGCCCYSHGTGRMWWVTDVFGCCCYSHRTG